MCAKGVFSQHPCFLLLSLPDSHHTQNNTGTACIFHRNTLALHTCGELPVYFPLRKQTKSHKHFNTLVFMFLYNIITVETKLNKLTPIGIGNKKVLHVHRSYL